MAMFSESRGCLSAPQTLEPQEVPKLKMTPEEKEEYKQRAKEYR